MSFEQDAREVFERSLQEAMASAELPTICIEAEVEVIGSDKGFPRRRAGTGRSFTLSWAAGSNGPAA